MVTPARRRLDHVDAMRPVKQAGVISTHTVVTFAPAAASVSSGAVLLLLHVSRLGFFFVSSCMLTYTYRDLTWRGLPRFYWRRFVSVGVPYLCWTVIYFFFLLPTAHYHGIAPALKVLASMAETGYYQLYFLLVIMQFYVVFPLVLVMLRRTAGHHGPVAAAAVLAQAALSVLTHWGMLPPLMQKYSEQDALSYVLYLAGGCVVACHLEQADAWVRRHARLVVALTAVSALAAECVYFLARYGVTTVLGSGSDPFQPSVIPFNAGAVACCYLAGAALVRPGRSRFVKAVVRSGSDNAYGVYLAHILVITTLVWLGWKNLNAVIPWPLLCLLTAGIVIACCVPLTALLARTPLAVPLTGRRRVPLRRPGTRQAAAAEKPWAGRRPGRSLEGLPASGLPRLARYRGRMPESGTRPLLFLDVDGTILPAGGMRRPATLEDWHATWQHPANPQLARINRAYGPRLLAMSCDLVWATAWMADANTVIGPILGLPDLPVADLGELPGLDDPVWSEHDAGAALNWKTRALVELAAGRPFAWIDDELTHADRSWVSAHHRGQALLHRVDSGSGLTDADLTAVERWLRAI